MPKRKRLNPREPSGRPARAPRPEREQDVVSLAVENRRKHWQVPEGQERSQLAGSKFGLLRLFGHLTTEQYEAGLRWARIARAYARVLGSPSPVPKSQSLAQLVTAHESELESLSPEYVAWVRTISRIIATAFLEHREGRQYRNAIAQSILEDQAVDIGTLREGLNILVRVLR
jgi:hypothetical protein